IESKRTVAGRNDPQRDVALRQMALVPAQILGIEVDVLAEPDGVVDAQAAAQLQPRDSGALDVVGLGVEPAGAAYGGGDGAVGAEHGVDGRRLADTGEADHANGRRSLLKLVLDGASKCFGQCRGQSVQGEARALGDEAQQLRKQRWTDLADLLEQSRVL